MKNKIIGIIGFVMAAIMLGIIISIFIFKHETGENIIGNELQELKSVQLCCEGTKEICFDVELAETDETRAKGLMYREYLSDIKGMLFIFDDLGIRSFWMKNTLIPLAGVRMDENMKVVDIVLMDPCKTEYCISYQPIHAAKYVLEINQHLITNEKALNTGDYCYFK